MSRLSSWCSRRYLLVVMLWVGLLVGLTLAALSVGADYRTVLTLPNSDSATATALLQEHSPAVTGTTGSVVWRADGTTVTAPRVEQHMNAVLDQIERSPGVASVLSPYTAAGRTHISGNGTVAYATVTFAPGAEGASAAHVAAVTNLAEGASDGAVRVALSGSAFTVTPAASEWSEIVGVLLAGLVLFLVFRSAWAAALPVVTAVAGVGGSIMATMLLSHVVTLTSVAPTLGALIGLGVGIDYALFIVNRHSRTLLSGTDVREAIATAMGTSGRAVLFAGVTVVIALLGMVTLRIDFLNGLALGAALTVLLTELSALTLLPALLSLLGLRVLSRAQRRELAAGRARSGLATESTAGGDESRWARWAEAVRRRPRVLGVGALVVLVLCALPMLSLRLGSPDAGSYPATSTNRQAYDMLADGFGPGFNGPLVLAAEVPDAAANRAANGLLADLRATGGVASVSPAAVPAGQSFAAIVVTPTTSPQSVQTTQLIDELPSSVIPHAIGNTGLKVYVGGTTASNDDFASVLLGKLPLFIGVIAVLGLLLLMLAFRSLLVPVLGAVTNVLTLGIALGAVVVVFQHGLGSALLGVGSAAPVDSFVPVLVIGVMFGLSMDYQVFLVSRMHEEWTRTRDHGRSVRIGQAETGQVIVVAATIMFSVFAAFAGGGMRVIAEFGLGLAVAVALDALVVRMVLVPALLHTFGPAAWWLPRWLDCALPHISVEGGEVHAPAGPHIVHQATDIIEAVER